MLCVNEYALSCIIGESLLGHFVFRIDLHFEGVSSEFELWYVNTLTIDVSMVNVFAAWGDSLVTIALAVVFGLKLAGALVVLQAKASFVTLQNTSTSVEVQYIKMSENLQRIF